MTTEAKKLLQPILDGGVRHANFVNGALLTGESLRAEQQANHAHFGRLGRAAGAGVAFGMEVHVDPDNSVAQPLVYVTPGMAVNRCGSVMELICDVQLRLSRSDEELSEAGGFADCGLDHTAEIPAAPGFYVLTATTASGLQGSAPLHGLHDGGRVRSCTRRYSVDGLQFRLVHLDASTLTSVDLTPASLAELSLLRSSLAHHCAGTRTVASFGADPLRRDDGRSAYALRGAIDDLRSLDALTDCDVPLALIFWSNVGIRFVDNWCVRRRIVPPDSTDLWPLVLGDRARADGEAIFHQFQDQIESLTRVLPTADLSSARAVDYFQYLPPAGIVPLATPAHPAGFVAETFFDDLPTRGPSFLEGPMLRGMLRASLDQPPMSLEPAPATPGASDQPPGERGELLHLYSVRENVQSDPEDPESPIRFLAFARAGAEVQTLSRYDFSHFDHADFV